MTLPNLYKPQKPVNSNISDFKSPQFNSFSAQGFYRMSGVEGDSTTQARFVEDRCHPLIDFDTSDSTELWLIQWPIDEDLDFDKQEISLKLNGNGILGNFTGTSGKEYEVASFKSLDADATVFVSSSSGSKAVGKVSRRVSFVHYLEPNEVPDPNKVKEEHNKAFFERSLKTASSRFGPSKSRSTLITNPNGSSKLTNSSRSGSNQGIGVSQVNNTPPNSSRKRKSSGSSDTKSSKVKQEQ